MKLEWLWLIPIGIGTFTILFITIKSFIDLIKGDNGI